MEKTNGVMILILNKIHKFEEKEKLLAMCISYIEVIEKLTDLERLQDNTIEERRQDWLLKPLLTSLRLLTHQNFPLDKIL